MCEYLNFPSGKKIKISRTFYELVLIRKSIEEDINSKKLCWGLRLETHNCKFIKDHICDKECELYDEECLLLIRKMYLEDLKSKQCWHQCYFPRLTDNNDQNIKYMKKILNDSIIKEYNLIKEEMSLEIIIEMTNKELNFFENYYYNCLKNGGLQSCSDPGTTTNFGYESERGYIKSMCIYTQIHKNIIINAVKLEMSLKDNYRILYRGSDYKIDNVYDLKNTNKIYSLSYGTSLFAGCMFDGGATAYHYMRKRKNAYALIIPENCEIFHLPEAGLSQIYGKGEIFHVRTKAWEGYIECADILKSNIPKETLIKRFKEIKITAIQLK